MKRIEGLVCVGETENGDVLFGRGIHDLSKPYEDIQTNGLSPYRIVSEAMKGLERIKVILESDCVEIKRIKMHVAENEFDIDVLKKSDSLIVVIYDKEGVRFIGPRIGYHNGNPFPEKPLYDNGLTPFTSFEHADQLASKLNRPPDYVTTLASFRLGR